jgi:ubiquinone/menaquinone biosynthesis C-methylase UbiE
VVTRGALLVRATLGGPRSDVAHVYPVYSNMRLIRLVDYQPIISAILLFQYNRLVTAITSELRRMALRGQDVMITSCAFGTVIPDVVGAAMEAGARQVLILDVIKNELDHAREKLPEFEGHLVFLEENCTHMKEEDNSVAANVIFFLLHELPHHLKGEALKEAVRVLAPGGKLFLAEFHRPDPWLLRALSWTYFKAFEPLGLALWNTHDPLHQLEEIGGLTCTRRTVFFGNFQVIVATKDAA